MIQGVELKQLTTFPDERGYFREIIRFTDAFFAEGFGQWSHSLMYAGTIKAWHVHEKQIDWWYSPIGVLKVVLHDLRFDSPTRGETNEFMLGDNHHPAVLRIPTGVAHGCKAITEAHLCYITSRSYDPQDEWRLAHDDPMIGYDWLAGPEIT